MSTMLLSPMAGLLRFSQEDIVQIAPGAAGQIRPPSPPGVELLPLSSVAKPLQVLSSLLSNAASNSSLVLTLLSSTMLQSRPGIETVIETLGMICRVLILSWGNKQCIPKCFAASCYPTIRLCVTHIYYSSTRSNACTSW